MSTNKEDRSFKTLINRETTDSQNKYYFNEFGADTINVHADDIWAETIPYDDPALGILLGRVEEQVLFVLTEDITVPNNQSWKAGTKDWISPKYGATYVARLFDGSDNEIFPTDALDWFFDYQTGILTFNDVLARPTPLKVTGYRYIGLKGAGGGGSDTDILYSLTPITTSVDYNDAGAVDPPADKYFSTQDEVDDFLVAAGATNFKHLEKLWDSLPVFIFHPVTINVAAGEQRAHVDATSFGFELGGKYMIRDGYVVINGSSPSEWLDVVAAQTITSHQVLSGTGDDFWNPWVRVAGTPFAGQNLKGLYAVLDTGQTVVIHDHDDNTLYLMQKLSPAPVDGVTAVTVARPSTVFQNSVDGVAAKGTSGCMSISNDTGSLYGRVQITNAWLQSFGKTWHINSNRSDARVSLGYVLLDWIYEKDVLGFTSGRGIQGGGTNFYFTAMALRSRNDINDQSPYYLSGIVGDSQSSMFYSYCGGHRRHISMDNNAVLGTYCCVFEEIGYQEYYGSKSIFTIYSGANFRNQHHSYYEGKRTTFIAGSSTGNAFHCDGTANLFNSGFTFGLWFRGFVAPVIFLENGGIDTIDASPGLFNDPTSDDDANSDVGIEVAGSAQNIRLNSNVEVRGTVGELRIEGVVGPYSDLPPQTDALVTKKLNILSRD